MELGSWEGLGLGPAPGIFEAASQDPRDQVLWPPGTSAQDGHISLCMQPVYFPFRACGSWGQKVD